MLSALRARLSYANVMATIAVFLALGGGAYALTLPRNSVKSKHIGKGQVKRPDIGKNAVTSVKVKRSSLLASDFKAGQLPAGPPGAALGYAYVAANGTLDPNLSSANITQANVDNEPVDGTVCFDDLPFTARTAIAAASGNAGSGGDEDVVATVQGPGAIVIGTCSGRWVVQTFDISTNALTDRPFFIWWDD